MKTEAKVKLFNTLFFSIIIGVVFTIAGELVTNGAILWDIFPIKSLVGIILGFIVGIIIPGGKCGVVLARKVANPDTFLFNFIMYAVLLLMTLVFMCPILTVFTDCVLMGAPVANVLSSSYSLFIPFFLIGIVLLMIFGGLIMKLSMKCAGVLNNDSLENN
ncbi:MAG: hypothetical protein ACOWWH_11795 [Eubacteriaceae bacterium]